MSSLGFGVMTARRVAAEKGKSEGEKPPGTKPYVDIFAALVPAEVLAVWAAVVLANTTKSATDVDPPITVISNAGLMKGSYFALLVVSSVLYVVGRVGTTKWDPWPDVARTLIPPAAFTGWMMLQRPGVYDVLTPDWSTGSRTVCASIGAVVLAAIAARLAYKANENDPPQ